MEKKEIDGVTEDKEVNVETEEAKVTEETTEKVDNPGDEYKNWLKGTVVNILKDGPTVPFIVTAKVLAAGINWEDKREEIIMLAVSKFKEVQGEVEGVMKDLVELGVLKTAEAKPVGEPATEDLMDFLAKKEKDSDE